MNSRSPQDEKRRRFEMLKAEMERKYDREFKEAKYYPSNKRIEVPIDYPRHYRPSSQTLPYRERPLISKDSHSFLCRGVKQDGTRCNNRVRGDVDNQMCNVHRGLRPIFKEQIVERRLHRN